LTDTV